jgi:ferredoxin-nitrite reductase
LLSELLSIPTSSCPGLFYSTNAQDGILSRIRIPGGIINSEQCRVISDIADVYGGGYVDVTNRANIQIREIRTNINTSVLERLQNVGLGRNPIVDHIRNIMTSPTAGIDYQELFDTRTFVNDWDNYLVNNPGLSGLSAKFSVCFDGGGGVCVRDIPSVRLRDIPTVRLRERINDIGLFAVNVDGDVYFQLCLCIGKGKPPEYVRVLLRPEQCLPVLVALTDVYLDNITQRRRDAEEERGRRVRLREVICSLGVVAFLGEVERRLSFTMLRVDSQEHQTQVLHTQYNHVGIHPQRQSGLSYIGVVLPLGRLETSQLRGLANLAEIYGSGTLRFTPWQNLLIPDIPNSKLAEVKSEITRLGLDYSKSNINSALVACSGTVGCASSATDTHSHAKEVAKYLENLTDQPINIHFTGCEKSCAQHHPSDITLLGVSAEVYHVYVGDGEEKFGRKVAENLPFSQIPSLIEAMLRTYQNKRKNPQETFREFVNRDEGIGMERGKNQ